MTRPKPLLKLLGSFLLLSLSTFAQTENSTYRPGTLDPAGNSRNLTLFRDEQIYTVGVPSSTGSAWRAATMSFDTNLKPTSSVSPLGWSSDFQSDKANVAATSGRIVHPDKDDIILVQRSAANPSTLVARLSDNSASTNLTTSLLNRVSGYADFISTSAGDLDNLYDATGSFHDEVVVAWTELDTSAGCQGNVVPHLGVLNYNGNSPSSPNLTSVAVTRSDGAYYDVCALGGYNYRIGVGSTSVPTYVTQPNDNIVATAIGDFDGDGKNEIALAYMRNGGTYATITIAIYRYLNDGTTTSLTQVNSFDLTIPDSVISKSSMVATVSLAAGNFDGSGVDQLLVGTAAWYGTVGANGEYTRGTFISRPVAFLLTAGQTLGSIQSAAPDTQDSTTTDISVSLGMGKYVPQAVTISGAGGTWSEINGTWPVKVTATGFTLDIDSSAFGSFDGQTVSVTVAAPLAQADFLSLDPYQGEDDGTRLEVDDTDVDAYIRVQLVPGLFHYDPSNGFDVRRRQIAMEWNARDSPRYAPSTQDADTHLAILQVSPQDKIQLASYQNGLIGEFQLFQSFSLAAGALVGDNSENDPTWSLYLSGLGSQFDHNQPFGSRNVYTGLLGAVLKVSPVTGDPSKLATSTVCSDKASSDSYQPPTLGAADPVCPIWVDAETAVTPNEGRGLRLPSVAADLKGNSLRLGAPIHAQVFNPAKMDYILEQPPQHTAWLDLGNGPKVFTVNRNSSFNTEMSDSNGMDLTTNDKDHLDWNIGGSASLTASQTTSVGPNSSQLSANQSVTGSVSAKVSYDRNTQSNSYNSSYSSNTVGQKAATGKDDYLVMEGQIFDIWRYRLYGSGTATGDPNNPYSFYEIVLPGPSATVNGGGLNTDWYQPIHEIGNILSYPGHDQVCGSDSKSPADLGPITYPTNPPTTEIAPYVPCNIIFYDGTSTTKLLQLKSKSGSGTTTGFQNKLHADLNFNVTYQSKFQIAGTGEQSKVSADVDIHGGADWGHLHVSDGTTSNATNIQINSPGGDNTHSYPFYPIMYSTNAGGIKVAYAVGDLSIHTDGNESASAFWTDVYGQKPDPALNLPFRFNYQGVQTGWVPETKIARKQMKGFAIRRAQLDTNTNEYPLLGRNPDEGETVLLDIRVYNYSLSSNATSPFEVKIYTIPYDPSTDREVCQSIPTGGFGGRVCPASARTFIGTASTQVGGGQSTFTLNARQYADAYYLWTIKNLGPAAGVNDYRVYVVLDSGNDPSVELYPAEPACTKAPCEDNAGNEGASGTFSTLDPGQNNEGWSLMSVGPLSPTLLGGQQKDARSNVIRTELSATGPGNGAFSSATEAASSADGKWMRRPCRRCKRKIIAYLHQPVHMRIAAFGKFDSRLWRHAIVYDLGDPEKRTVRAASGEGNVIAGKYVRGTGSEGSSVWFDWTPQTKGLHHLHAEIQNPEGTKPAGDLWVWVRRSPCDLNGDGRVDRHDLNILNRDLGKTTTASACGESCDLDGDGKVTEKDLKLMSGLCDATDCAFGHVEYVGGASLDEPNMQQIRQSEAGAKAAFVGLDSEDSPVASEAQLYQAELQRKQSLRSIRYYYRGKPVTAGPHAQPSAAIAKR